MRRIVTDEFQRLGILPSDDPDFRVVLDGAEEVPLRAVDIQDERRLGEAGTDGLGDLRARHALFEVQRLAVGQGDMKRRRRGGHGVISIRKSGRTISQDYVTSQGSTANCGYAVVGASLLREDSVGRA